MKIKPHAVIQVAILLFTTFLVGFSGTAAFAADTGPAAVGMIEYALGESGDSCFSCVFLAYFMEGMTDFSKAVFDFMLKGFQVLVPVIMLAWIGWKVAGLMVRGGEDGKSFIYSFAGRMALFFMVWLVATTTVSGTTGATSGFLWKTVGPTFLNTAFGFSNSVRDASLSVIPSSSTDPFNCTNVKILPGGSTAASKFGGDPEKEFIVSGLELGCMVERTHSIGIASGIAVLTTSGNKASTGAGGWASRMIHALTVGIFTIILKVIIGVFLIVIYGVSVIWLVFLILDVVVRGLVTAAFSPVIAGMYLFPGTRGFANKTIQAMGGAFFTATAISLVGTLAFFLVSNVIDLYQGTYLTITRNPSLQPLSGTSDIGESFKEFVERIADGDTSLGEDIPLDLRTPWFYYLVLVGASIFALGKKLIAMIQGIVGEHGQSAMADNATRKISGAAMAAGLAGAGTAYILQNGARVATGAASYGAGGAAQVLGRGGSEGAQKFAKGAFGVGHSMFKPYNPFARTDGSAIMGGSPRGAEFSRGTAASMTANAVKGTASGIASQAGNPPETKE